MWTALADRTPKDRTGRIDTKTEIASQCKVSPYINYSWDYAKFEEPFLFCFVYTIANSIKGGF